MTEGEVRLEEMTIDGIRQALGVRSSSHSIATYYLARIRAIDADGFRLHSVNEVNPDALAVADQLDRLYCKDGPMGPLNGISVLIKDNIDTRDSMLTTAGSLALADAPSSQDAFIVERMRTAGALILGKTNLSEWADFRDRHSISGWSARGGQCRNPYVLDRTPCGSSSGAAVAVAADLCVVSVGTETDGSIVYPASMNGVVGLKPTVGLISRTGVIPIAHSQDTPGPIGRTVTDVAILLSTLAGVDERDPATEGAEGKVESDYAKFLDPKALRGARLGVAREFFGSSAATDRVISDRIDTMKHAGAKIIDPITLSSQNYVDSELDVLLYEFKTDLNNYLKSRSPHSVQVHSLHDVIAFNERRHEEMRYFGQDLLIEANRKGPLTEQTYLDSVAQNHRLSKEEGIDAVVKTHQLDAIVAPTIGPAWLIDTVNGDPQFRGCSRPAAVAGYPHITVPAGLVRGLPVGISFFGSAWSEPTLLGLAFAFEQVTHARRIPKYIATVDFKQ